MIHDVRTYPAAYIHQDGAGDDQILELLRWLGVHPSDLTIVGPGMRNLDYSPVVREVIRAGATATSTRSRGWRPRTAILALWPDDEGLSRLESSLPSKMAVAPWVLADIDIWRLARDPLELSGAAVSARPALDPVVAAAMKSVAELSNPNNGLTGYNRSYAVAAFRTLRRNRYTWNPLDTAVVMARHGWRLNDAREFARLSADMLAGKALKGGADRFRPNILQIWRKEAADSNL